MTRRVAIVGAGAIGVAFAIVFARAGREVALWDVDPDRLPRAIKDVHERLQMLNAFDLLDEPIEALLNRISTFEQLADALHGAELVQECAPESADLKSALFVELAHLTPDGVILASSSSALTPSQYSAECPARSRIFGAHPANPPYLLPLIEVIPGPFTEPAILRKATMMYEEAGLTPVLVPVEIEGFIMNRLQGAVLREAYCLVRDGVATVEAVDTVMRTSLGPRWSFMGPFETIDLNTQGGITEHARRMGPAYFRMGESRGMSEPWTPDLIADVDRQRRDSLPLQQWLDRVHWRDAQLMRLNQLRRAELAAETDE